MSWRNAEQRRRSICRRPRARCPSSASTPMASSPGRPALPVITTRRWPPSRFDAMTPQVAPDTALLTAQVQEATAAAANAYRDAARLIRLLTVLSNPSPPGELREQALNIISEVFTADVVCVATLTGDRLRVTSASGLPEDDPSFAEGWAAGTVARQATRGGPAVVDDLQRIVADVPPSIAHLGLRSAVFVPMSTRSDPDNDLLILYRSSEEPFNGADLHILASVAQRIHIAAQDRERA